MKTLVLVLTDVQGSTRLWQDEPTAMDAAMMRHHEIVHGAVEEHGGWRPVDQGEGDAVFAAFPSASNALEAVAQVQRDLAAEPWPTSVPLKVRIGVHVGEVTERGGNLYGDPVNRCARLRGLGAGGQTLLSAPVYELVRDKLPTGASVTDLGEHRMKDLVRPEHVWQLDLDGLPTDFPPLSSLDRVLHNLPIQPSPLIGRETDLASVLAALESHRLVTLTGFGGMGKTRLSLQAAAELADGDGDGVWFVDLASTTDPAAVPGLVGRATGLGGADADSVIEALSGQQLLLVLDNLEQVMGCATFVADLLARVPGVKVLATSREPLRVRGEQELALAPLALPPVGELQDAATLSTYAAVQLFVERAVAVKATFEVTNDNAPSVAAICQRLDGHPLAIELAASRVRMMTPQALLPRLDRALSVLTSGSRDMPARHQTLRATIAWSYDSLDPDEQLLLQRLSVFPAPADLAAVEAVCGADLDVFTALSGLTDKSLVRVLPSEGEDRYGLLVSIRDFAAELLDPAQLTPLRDAHSRHYIDLVSPVPPISRAELHAAFECGDREIDHLLAAWQHVLSAGDPTRIAAFPVRIVGGHLGWDLGDLPAAVAMIQAVVDSSPAATTQLAGALSLLATLGRELGADVPPAVVTRLAQVGEQLDRPDVRLFIGLYAEDRPEATPAEIVAGVAEAEALVPLIPADSPFSADWLRDYVDNMSAVQLRYVEPERALAAARRNHASGSMGVLGLVNLARALVLVGRDDEVEELLLPVATAPIPRVEQPMTLVAVTLFSDWLVGRGEPERALGLLTPWENEVQRRGSDQMRTTLAAAKAFALLRRGEPVEALRTIEAAGHLTAKPTLDSAALSLLSCLVRRETAEEDDPAVPGELVRALAPLRHRKLLTTWVALLVEQALREPDPAIRRVLAEQAEAERNGLQLPYGYLGELRKLRGQA